MNTRAITWMLVRVVAVFAAVSVLIYSYPEVVQHVLSPLIRVLTEATCPYMEHIALTMEGMTMHIRGSLVINMSMTDGSVLPAAPGTWQKQAGPTLHMLVVALAVFAAPSVPVKKRLIALPFTLAATLLVCSYHLSVEIQESALRVIGQSWLSSLPLASTDANRAYFQAMESHFDLIRWIKSFNDGGGSLFLAVLAGLSGYAFAFARGVQTTSPSTESTDLKPPAVVG